MSFLKWDQGYLDEKFQQFQFWRQCLLALNFLGPCYFVSFLFEICNPSSDCKYKKNAENVRLVCNKNDVWVCLKQNIFNYIKKIIVYYACCTIFDVPTWCMCIQVGSLKHWQMDVSSVRLIWDY